MAERVRVGVLGASGYGGAGLLERLGRHAGVDLVAVGSRQYAGDPVEACWPQFAGLYPGLRFEANEAVLDRCQAVFCATPHGATAPLVKRALDAGLTVVDLSADFRLPPETYARWYGLEHPHPELYRDARYGLVELHRDELAAARLIASPGCNATAASLALAPLAAAGLLGPSAVASIVTGVSGAGRAPSQALHYTEMNENARPYKVAGTHRHTAEIEATTGRARVAGKHLETHAPFEPYTVSFNPVIVPMSRGILATCTTTPATATGLGDEALLQRFRAYYQGDPLIVVQDELPQTKAVAGSDRAVLSVRYDARSGTVAAFCAIDNLGKGAAGQAVQAFNVAHGFDEAEGLARGGMWP
ncbi:MAG TPA: N-acetyl-gamma-glutamyl-phosphate reductase [Trueperaceae bacterium]|nr:N-acetyl-gamma-glutamyl-phosphate reductase [Trueperaceae bacterium]